MLYDPKWNYTEQEKNRVQLIELLRDKSKWPEGFEWRFVNCGTCAMGLLYRHLEIPETVYSYNVDEGTFLAERLGLDPHLAYSIFWQAGFSGERLVATMTTSGMFDKVTPEYIADLLEATLPCHD